MQVFRNLVHGFAGKAVLGVVIALFVLYGTEALVSLTGQPAPVAKVNDAELYNEQLTNMVEQQKQMILRQNPGLPLDFIKDEYLRSQVAQRWVDRQLIDQALDEWGIRPDQTAVITQLKSDNRFSIDGEIQQEQLESWLRSNGLSAQSLFDEIRTNLGLDQLLTGLEASEFIVPREVEQIQNLQQQTRQFSVARIAPSAVQSDIELDDSELQEFYEAHLDRYMEPASAQVQYLELDLESLTASVDVTPTEADLFGYYETYKQSLKQDEARSSSHILIESSSRSEDEALELVTSIADKIKAGEDFSELAKEFSDDAPSAEEGGSLPSGERGTYVQPFEDALYALDTGDISEPVKTEFGYHIIRLDGVEAKTPDTFEDKRADLEQEYTARQKQDAFRTLLDEAALVAFESANLDEVAAQYELTVQKSTSFSRPSAPAPLNNPKVLDAIFAADFFSAGRNSDLIELDDTALIVHPVTYKEAAPNAYAKVKDQVKESAELEAARALAEEKGRDIIAKLKVGNELTEKEQELLGDWTDYTDVDRRSGQVSAQILKALFAMPKPTEEQPILSGFEEQDDFVVLKLNSIDTQSVEDEAAQSELEALAGQLKQSASRSLATLLVDALKDSADIEFGARLVSGEEGI